MKHHGVNITKNVPGSGAAAEGDVEVKIRTKVFLNRGEAVSGLWEGHDDGYSFLLRSREIIPGLRYAVEGMRVGGHREVEIPPHLAFGKNGYPGKIPPDALLRLEIDLIDASKPGEPLPLPARHWPGRSLSIRADGEESSPFPRWILTFCSHDHPHYPTQCHLSLEWSLRSDGKWRSKPASRKSISLAIPADRIERLIALGSQLPHDHPDECLHHGDVHTHGGYSPTRSNKDRTLCRHVSMIVNGSYLAVCYLPETSVVWTETEWGTTILSMVQPYLTQASWR